MNILASPNTMKGSLNADDFAALIGKAFRKVSPVYHVRSVPIADGGDFTGPVICKHLNARMIKVQVADPLGREIEAEMGIAGDIAVIEMASASGLRLLSPGEPNPEVTTSLGTGQLIRRAIGTGCGKIYLGLGGSATVDGGIGILEALGFRFLDANGLPLPGVPGSLGNISRVLTPDHLKDIEITLLCDVNNPLLGDDGAARTFGPQKGADKEMVERLETGLARWAEVLRQQTGKNTANTAGAGAAGGIPVALMAFTNARLVQGADFIFDLLDIGKHLEWADLVITGEGSLDRQSLAQKAPVALALRARKAGKPVLALAGSYDTDIDLPFDAVFSIQNKPLSLDRAKAIAGDLAYDACLQIARLLLASDMNLRVRHDTFMKIGRLFQDNRLKEAEALLENNTEDLSVYWYYKGLFHSKRQKWGDALNALSKALEFDPENNQARTKSEIIKSILGFSSHGHLNP